MFTQCNILAFNVADLAAGQRYKCQEAAKFRHLNCKRALSCYSGHDRNAGKAQADCLIPGLRMHVQQENVCSAHTKAKLSRRLSRRKIGIPKVATYPTKTRADRGGQPADPDRVANQKTVMSKHAKFPAFALGPRAKAQKIWRQWRIPAEAGHALQEVSLRLFVHLTRALVPPAWPRFSKSWNLRVVIGCASQCHMQVSLWPDGPECIFGS